MMKCEHCEYEWVPRKDEKPKRCPNQHCQKPLYIKRDDEDILDTEVENKMLKKLDNILIMLIKSNPNKINFSLVNIQQAIKCTTGINATGRINNWIQELVEFGYIYNGQDTRWHLTKISLKRFLKIDTPEKTTQITQNELDEIDKLNNVVK